MPTVVLVEGVFRLLSETRRPGNIFVGASSLVLLECNTEYYPNDRVCYCKAIIVIFNDLKFLESVLECHCGG